MDSTSMSSLLERAGKITAGNCEGNGAAPPAVSVADPFREVLMREIAESLPAELAGRMMASGSPSDVDAWIGAGALFRWVKDDPTSREAFLGALHENPRQAGLALARAVAARLEPPPRNTRWRRLDTAGLVFQMLAVSLVLAGRVLLSWACGVLVFSLPARPASLVFWLAGLTDLPVLTGDHGGGWLALAAFGLMAVWHLAEAACFPRWFERLRQMPAKRNGVPRPLSWRTDSFAVAWAGQALLLLACVSCSALGAVWRMAFAAVGATAGWPALAVVAAAFVFVFWRAARAAGSVLSLGTQSG